MYRRELESHDQPSYLDLWNSNPLYGKIDTNFNIVQASAAKLQLLPDLHDKQNLFALDFVSDAFRAMKLYLEIMESKNELRPGSFFHPLNAHAGWQSAHELYERHVLNMHDQFVKVGLSQKRVKHYNSLRTFDDYLPAFVEFLNRSASSGRTCLTRSGFISKSLCPRSVSGLTIEIAKEKDSSDDRRKFAHYFSDPQFPIYVDVATKFGFYVDMNMPWRLVANLESPAWQKNKPLRSIMEAHFPDGYTPQKMFDQYFTKPQGAEFEEFKTMALAFYTSFRSKNPSYDVSKVCQMSTSKYNKVRRVVKPRRNITMAGMMVKYDDVFWFRLYMQLRIREMELDISERQVKHELREIEQRYSNMGSDSVVEYITERLAYYLRKQMGKFSSLQEERKNLLISSQTPDIML